MPLLYLVYFQSLFFTSIYIYSSVVFKILLWIKLLMWRQSDVILWQNKYNLAPMVHYSKILFFTKKKIKKLCLHQILHSYIHIIFIYCCKFQNHWSCSFIRWMIALHMRTIDYINFKKKNWDVSHKRFVNLNSSLSEMMSYESYMLHIPPMTLLEAKTIETDKRALTTIKRERKDR